MSEFAKKTVLAAKENPNFINYDIKPTQLLKHNKNFLYADIFFPYNYKQFTYINTYVALVCSDRMVKYLHLKTMSVVIPSHENAIRLLDIEFDKEHGIEIPLDYYVNTNFIEISRIRHGLRIILEFYEDIPIFEPLWLAYQKCEANHFITVKMLKCLKGNGYFEYQFGENILRIQENNAILFVKGSEKVCKKKRKEFERQLFEMKHPLTKKFTFASQI